MTQQSLITRLKAVEEAMDLALQEWGPCDCSTCSGARSALSDLRELIKEAEEQKSAAFQSGDGVVPKTQLKHGKELYTALGEKP